MDWGDLLRAVIADRTNPPLFYALLKLWIGIGGESVAWMRLLPCTLGIAAAAPLAALARRTFELLDSPGAGAAPGAAPGGAIRPTDAPSSARPAIATVVTLAIAAASPLLVLLSNELRAYSLLLLLATASLLAFARVTDASAWLGPGAADGESPSWLGQARGEYQRRLVLLAAANTLMVYTHYFGWLVVAAEAGAALFWYRRVLRGALLGALATGALFTPWIVTVLASARGAPQPLSNVSWISRPALSAIPGFYDSLVARVLTVPLAWIGLVAELLPLAWLGVLAVTRGAQAATSIAGAGPAIASTGASASALVGTPRSLGMTVTRLLWFAVFPVLVVFALSVATGHSAFVPRYLVVAAPAWWMLLGLAVTRLPGVRGSVGRLTVVAGAWCGFTIAAGTLRMVRGNEKIAWNEVVAAVASDADGATGTVYSLEGFTALPLLYYSRSRGVPLTVQPIRPANFADVRLPAWLVVREPTEAVAGPVAGAVVAALTAAGLRGTEVRRDSILSQQISVLRLARTPP